MTIIKRLGTQSYSDVWAEMKRFTTERTPETPDELWLLEHPPVYTQGQAGKPEHILQHAHTIPIIQADRGGQVTYHGPGQLVGYTLMDIRRNTHVCMPTRKDSHYRARALSHYRQHAHRCSRRLCRR